MGEKKCISEVFFSIITKYRFRALIKSYIDLLKAHQLSLSIKNAIRKYVVKVGYFIRLNLKYTDECFYKERFRIKANQDKVIFVQYGQD